MILSYFEITLFISFNILYTHVFVAQSIASRIANPKVVCSNPGRRSTFYFIFIYIFYFYIFVQLSWKDDFSPNIAPFALKYLPHMQRAIMFHMSKKNLYVGVVHLCMLMYIFNRQAKVGLW